MSEIKINERGFEILCLLAFRYAINRHGTQCMTRGLGNGDTVESIVLDNLEHINANFKCQMMEDISNEYRIYDSIKGEEDKWMSAKKVAYSNGDGYFWRESPYYLEPMLKALKEDYKATHDGEEWHEGVQI